MSLLSILAILLMDRLRVPAAIMLGPLLAAIALALNGGTLRLSPYIIPASHGVIGCMVAHCIDANFIVVWKSHALLLVCLSASLLIVASAIGLLVSAFSRISRSTTLMGFWPGVSPVMITLAEASGGDSRMVAVIQYGRVFLVAVAAGLLAHFMLGSPPSAPRPWLQITDWQQCAMTLSLAAAGAYFGKKSGLPSGAFLFPAIAGGVLHTLGIMTIELPFVALAAAYGLIGWQIGLAFSRQDLAHCGRHLPVIVAASIGFLVISALAAVIISQIFELDLLTAFLATSPGGVDSVMILATTGSANVTLILAAQLTRLLFVVIVASWLSARLKKNNV